MNILAEITMVAHPALNLLLNVAILCIVAWAIYALVEWLCAKNGWSIPTPVRIVAIALVCIVLVVLLVRLVSLLL